ncbi:MAG: dihydrofolate reductase, partial [Calditrichota bacterium]
MQKLIYYVAASLDGFIAREDGSFSDFVMDDEIVAHFMESLEQFSSVLMGRKTYEIGLAEGKTNPYPMLESYVVSRSLDQETYPEVNLISSNIEDAVEKIKTTAKNPIWLCGGGKLA